jgi:Na+-driven multidrug efflux pump
MAPSLSTGAIAGSLLPLAGQMIVTSFIQQANQLITIVTVGHLGNVEFMGAATLGGMVVNVCAFSLM